MAMFKGFKPEGLQKIANSMGYTGSLEGFSSYLQQNPDKQNMMNMYNQRAVQMAQGGAVRKMQQGGFNPFQAGTQAVVYGPDGTQYGNSMIAERAGVTDVSYTQPKTIQDMMVGKPVGQPMMTSPGFDPRNEDIGGPFGEPNQIPTKSITQNLGLSKEQADQFAGGFTKNVFPAQQPKDSIVSDDDNDYLQGYTPGYENQFPAMGTGPEADKFRQMAETRRKQIGKPPVLEDVEKRYDMSTLDDKGFAVKLDSQGNPTRNREKVSFFKERAQKKYDEQLAKHKEYQKIFGENYTVGQAEDYDRRQSVIKRNQNLKKLNPKFDLNYYNSPEYREFEKQPKMGTMDVVFSPYFGQQGSGSISSAQDAAYRKYLQRTGQDNLIKEGVIPQERMGIDFIGNIPQKLPSDFKTADPAKDDVGGGGFPIASESQRLAPWMEGYDFVGKKSLEEMNADLDKREREYKEANPNWEQEFQDEMERDRQRQRDLQNFNPNNTSQPTGTTMATDTNIEDFSVQQALNPTLPQGGATVAAGTPITQDQMVDPATGQLRPQAPTVGSAALGTTTTSTAPTATPAAQMDASLSNLNVTQALQPVQAAQGAVSQQSQMTAQQQTDSKVSDLQAAQGAATLMQNPVQREIQAGELISGGAANAQKASTYAEQIEAATATPSAQATVQGQLANLTANFDATNPPAWAAGALRGVQAQMAARGLGTSSMAAQAMIQGALESALPIAQADAQTRASFEQANLSNRQQRAMLAAQQRAAFIGQEFDQEFQSRVQNAAKISDIANMNFTAEQQIALENSRAANTMGLANLSNRQAMVMAEASALANLDMSNLNNRQQAAVQNAQAFMQMDMANLNNSQQTGMFKAQSLVQSLFNDQAATNASRQFNASSQNQTDQFFANLATTVANFNAEQANAMSRYNSGELNALEQFNANMKNQREQFNAQNRLVIDQSNAQWRRQVATADTAAINRANELNARALIELSTGAYNNLWQGFRDDMEFAWKSADNAEERAKDITLRKMQDESTVAAAAIAADSAEAASLAKGVVGVATSDIGSSIISSGLKWLFG